MGSFSNKPSNNRLFCFVDGCFTTSARNKILGFHKFPGNERKTVLKINKNGTKRFVNRRQLWIEALNIDKQATTVIGEMRVCSLHFSKNDFILAEKRRPFSYLKKTAIPRRNLPLRKNSKLSTRLQFRSFNRIKWRGRLAFQDPDGRLPVSKRRSLGSHRNERKNTADIILNNTKLMKKKPLISEIHEGESLDGEKIQLKTFSLAGKANTSFCSDSDKFDDDGEKASDGVENEIQCTTNELADELRPSQPVMTSEVIIKEEPLSDNELEMDSWPVDEEITEYNCNLFSDKNNSKEEYCEITTKSLRDDLESDKEFEDEDMVVEEDENYADEEMSEESEEETTVWRDRPCKICGKVDCKGHPKTRPSENASVCFVCTEIFESQKLLEEHSKIHDAETSGKNRLPEREQFYRQQRELMCKVCKRVLATKITLKEHMLIHTGEKPHVCMLCGRSFRHKANLVVHINAHTIVRTFECPMCPQTFSMRVDLDDHKRIHSDDQHRCNICHEPFNSKRALWTHQQIHNKRTQRKKRRGNRKGGLPCRVCGKMLSTKNTLKEHMMIHSGEKPHECQLCGKMIRHKANFIIHVQSHSSAETFKCDVCEFSFSRKSDLRHHKLESHGNKPFHCILCGASFRKEEFLRDHVETKHGDNPSMKDDDDDDEDYKETSNLIRPRALQQRVGAEL